jgi:hypothetical protein
VTVSAETKKALDGLRARLGARSYDELFRRLLGVLEECDRVMAGERARQAVCNDMLEVRGALAVWAKLLAKKLEEADDIAVALEYLTPDPKEPGIYVVDREKCLKQGATAAAAGSEPERRADEAEEATPRPEVTATETETKIQTKSPEPVPKPEEAEVGAGESVEDYVSNVLLPLIKERVGGRTVLTLKELRKLIESLTTLPPNEIIDVMLNLGIAELSGNQVTLKLT